MRRVGEATSGKGSNIVCLCCWIGTELGTIHEKKKKGYSFVHNRNRDRVMCFGVWGLFCFFRVLSGGGRVVARVPALAHTRYDWCLVFFGEGFLLFRALGHLHTGYVGLLFGFSPCWSCFCLLLRARYMQSIFGGGAGSVSYPLAIKNGLLRRIAMEYRSG